MTNHIHLLIKENTDTISRVMSRIGEPIGKLQGMERAERNEILRKIKASDGITLRQISRVTGLSVDIILKA
jgi:hypothetical protein